MKSDLLIGIELTRHCNLRCGHCFRADLDKFSEIPVEIVRKILNEALIYGKPHIGLTGGEATLHRQFPEILQMIIDHGFGFHFVTNGFNYKTVFKNLFPILDHPLFEGVSFSLDGATPETHDGIRGPGSFNRVLAGIAICSVHKKEVAAQTVIHRGNRHELSALALLCSKMGVSRFYLAHMQPTPHAVKHGLLHTPEECRQVEKEIADLQSQFKLPIYLSAGFYDPTPVAHCKFLKMTSLNINYRGELTMCCQLSNMEGSEGNVDVIADLSKVSLQDAHRQVVASYHEVFQARLDKIANHTHQDIDNFHCWSCMKHTKKVEWMRQFPENDWVKSDSYFQKKPLKQLKVL
ncbi:MAG: radical SAM protein [Bdellovibrionales bacterium]|nr:radical SAM protein [Bdellovibrionales bacterium]